MLTRLFTKDECAPDAKTARQWLEENDLTNYFDPWNNKTLNLTIEWGNPKDIIFSQNGKFYLVSFYDGRYEDIHELERQDVINRIEEAKSKLLEAI